MNDKKICFICCVKQEELYKKLLFYINNLEIPQGYEIENISIKNTECIAKEYNKEMRKTDAKYKVYIQEDIVIINENFINDIIGIFNSDKNIGMIGVIGSKDIPINGIWWQSNNKYGKFNIIYKGEPKLLEFNQPENEYENVKCIDGSIIITQYDIPWREDIFKGWNFYDISQSIEFTKAGYIVVIPKQEKPWYLNEFEFFNDESEYEKNRKIFLEEYSKEIFIQQEKLLNLDRKNVLIFSHSNYNKCMGGTEKYIYEQVQNLNSNGFEVIQVFPIENREFYDDRQSLYGINFNKNFDGTFPIEKLINIIQEKKSSINLIYIHHLMFWKYNDFKRIIDILKQSNIKIIFYAHDFFSCCPRTYLMDYPNNCILNNKNENSHDFCLKCNHCNVVTQWRRDFRYIFYLVEKIVVPSEFLKLKFNKIYPEFSNKVLIHGHLKLINKTLKQNKNMNNKIRLAYLGVETDIKGWKTWQRLYKNNKLIHLYEFYHIGCNRRYANNVSIHSYLFREDGIMAATDLLVKNNIDLVILWSIVPESYSYTLHETIAAGIPILTNEKSGNIADKIKKYGDEVGKIFKNEDELISFLLNKNEINKLIDHKRYTYYLQNNSLE